MVVVVCGGCGTGDIVACVCFSIPMHEMHLIGWQNTWEQAPGVPATPSPP